MSRYMTKPFLAFFLTILFLLPAPMQAATLHVPGDYRSIQEAVDAAAPSDAVVVKDGVYIENVEIMKPLTLSSSNGPAAVLIQAERPDLPAIKVSGTSDVTIAGVSGTGSKAAGILVSGSSNVTVTGNVFTKNGTGIMLSGTSRSVVSWNESSSNAQYGLYMEKSDENRVVSNSSTLNKDKGFFISYSNGNEISGNEVNLNTWDGIMVFSSNNNRITGNKTLRNTYGIVVSESKGNELEENTTLPNLFLILPIVLIYLGIVSYLAQKNILKAVYKE
ncbi:MAG: right-handed parallel beta-helix repeat-containing protein [Candidatus Methylomirabilis sp.]|nr:right-handed parallel beta-helix repeat-containing protein [Deltaproteobacteria bacterium]